MHMIITDGWLTKGRPVALSARRLAVYLFGLFVLAALITLALYKGVGALGSATGWWSSAPIQNPAQAKFERENIDALAKKVGDLQARLIELEALANRVSGVAGVEVQPPGARSEGGAITADRPLSMAQLTSIISGLDGTVQDNIDVLNMSEARFFERKLEKLTTPSEPPVAGVEMGSRFGWRIDPFNGHRDFHPGLDYAAPTGTPILSAAGGVVVRSELYSSGGYGSVIEIDHGNGLMTRYGHCSQLNVKAGDLVKKGQVIGAVGSTGRSTGPHLHFEVILDGVQVNPVSFLKTPETTAQAQP